MSTQLATQNDLKTFLNSTDISKQIDEILGARKSTFVTSLIQIANSNDLLKNAEPKSVFNAGLLATSLNLPLNNSLGHAYIVPFKNNKANITEAQFQIGYKGLQQLAMRTGLYLDIDAKVVYEGQYVEDNSFKGYHFNWKGKKSDNVVGYASYFRLKNGFESLHYMSKEDLEKHASRYSQTYKRGFGNWKDDFDKMGLKTVIKLLLNSGKAPLSVEMENAIKADQSVIDEYENGTIDISYVDNTPEPEQVTNSAKPTSQDISKQRFKDYLSSKLNKDTVDALSDEELSSLEKFTQELDSYADGKSVQSFAKSKTFSELEKELIKQKFAEFKK